MNDLPRPSLFFFVLISVIFLIVVSKLIGPIAFDNNWAFTQWHYLPLWWPIALTTITLALVYIVWKHGAVIINAFGSKNSPLIISGVLLISAILFHFDSFLYAGGNLTVAQISQADVIIKRPYEFGIVHLVSWLFYSFKLFLSANTAATWAWSAISWLSAFCSLWWGWQLSRFLTIDRATRTLITASIFLGPHAALFFGFVAPEPLIVAVTIGFTRFALEYISTKKAASLLSLWGLLLFGIVCYAPCLYLLPAAAYVTFSPLKTKNKRGTLLACATGAILIAAVYYFASGNLELASQILFPSGKNPNSDYGIFSIRHIGDMLQLFISFAPQILIIAYLVFTRDVKKEAQKPVIMLTTMTICGILTLWLIDPVHSIILDFPALLAYTSPLQLLAVVLLATRSTEKTVQSRQRVLAFSLVSLFVLLSWFPLNRSILSSQDYTESYFKQHENFYLAGSLAFRDALFGVNEMQKADEWEQKLSTKSPEYIDLEGCRNLSLNGQDSEALRELYKLKTNHPYWGDPRYIIAGIQIKLGRPQLAEPELDTALLLEPYNKAYLMARYSLYRDTRAYTKSLSAIRYALEFYPSDSLILSDYMLVSYRSGDIPRADSLRIALQERFPSLAYPLLVEGMIAENRGDLKRAERAFERFIAMAPNDPDTPRVRKMLNDIVLRLRDTSK